MEIKALEILVKNFCEERNWTKYHNPKDLAIGISTEANELLDIFRFKTEEQMISMMESEQERSEISDELADTLFFVLRFAQLYGFDLTEILQRKINKNKEKYQIEKVYGKNLKYNEYS